MTLVIAHRGASAAVQQNTLDAFRLAVEMGTDFIELDVRRSRDDVLIIHHDAHLPDGRFIVEHDYDDLPDFVPTLAEALDACEGARVNIEIKNEPDEPDYDERHQISDAVVGLALAFRPPEELLVTSFNLDTVKRIRAVNEDIPVGFVSGYDILQVQMLLDHLAESGMTAVVPYDPTVDRRFIERAHETGIAVYPWTVNDPERMAELIEIGIDGIITDTPDVARSVVDAAGQD
ncbi:MAG: glycerophosphodiester phosphodiesterase [Actinomycetota bacterium]